MEKIILTFVFISPDSDFDQVRVQIMTTPLTVLKIVVLSALMMNGEALLCPNCKTAYRNGVLVPQGTTECIETACDDGESCVTIRFSFGTTMRDAVTLWECAKDEESSSKCDEEKSKAKWAPGFADWECEEEYCGTDNCNLEGEYGGKKMN